jgi:pimeloyl-ACP methyl ester carboxylesterase
MSIDVRQGDMNAPTTLYTHDTVPTTYVEADGVRFAYRRFGKTAKTPVVFIQHFRGTMDNHDPAITDALADEREIILFDNRGIGATSGIARETIDDMARDTALFIDALGLSTVDLLGHSMGGEVAQMVATQRSDLVRRLILVGTGPRGGEGMATPKPSTAELFAKQYERQDEMWLPIMFAPSETSQAAGRAYLERIRRRPDRDTPVSAEAAVAHSTAARVWGRPNVDGFASLRNIAQQTLVVNGSDDVVIPTVNSFILQQHMPNAKLVLYPDSNHGGHYQFHDDFVAQVKLFLDGPEGSTEPVERKS